MDWLLMIGSAIVGSSLVIGVCLVWMECQWRRDVRTIRRISELMREAEK